MVLRSSEKVQAKVVRPNIECSDGYIHLVDTAMIDDTPPWTVVASKSASNSPHYAVLLIFSLGYYFML